MKKEFAFLSLIILSLLILVGCESPRPSLYEDLLKSVDRSTA